MGLPLFIVPVESDVPPRLTAKNTADTTHARSPIRRADQRRQQRAHQPHEIRDQRSRLIAALRGRDFEIIPAAATGVAALESQPTRHSGSDDTPTPEASPPRTEFEDLLSLIRDDEHRRLPPRPRWPLHSDSESRHEESFLRTGGSEPRHPGRAGESGDNGTRTYLSLIGQQAPNARPTLLQRIRSNGTEIHPRHARHSGRLNARMVSDDISLNIPHQDRLHSPDPGEYLEEYQRRRNPRLALLRASRRQSRLAAYNDGLGDRDRSLSPEGDGVWDTLQSTLTPDPQPPSVGSSFASTTASVAASQTTASSSSTSITNLDESVELPCDPVVDESDTDGDAGERNAEGRANAPRQSTSQGRRSYADVAADILPPSDGRVSRHEWLSDMQRIIQGLSAREDIPDEWWSAAGLSRSVVMGDD